MMGRTVPKNDLTLHNIIITTITREVTASVYDLMGHPGGERERSDAAEQHITRRADLLFQVSSMVMMMMMVMMVKNTIRRRY